MPIKRTRKGGAVWKGDPSILKGGLEGSNAGLTFRKSPPDKVLSAKLNFLPKARILLNN